MGSFLIESDWCIPSSPYQGQVCYFFPLPLSLFLFSFIFPLAISYMGLYYCWKCGPLVQLIRQHHGQVTKVDSFGKWVFFLFVVWVGIGLKYGNF